MLDSLKRWMRVGPEGLDARALANWAKTHGHLFKTVRNDRGGVIECAQGARQWRVEWGEPQRQYIEGSELRLREELGISSDIQLMLMSRSLATRLESDVFDRFTEAMQTQIDHNLPEEMRWLAMFRRVSLGEHKALKTRFQLLASAPGIAQAWFDSEVAQQLQQASTTALQADPPFVILVLRGRLYLRMQLLAVEGDTLDAVDAVFAAAAQRMRIVATAAARTGAPSAPGSDWPSTTASAWQTQAPDSGLLSNLPSELPGDAGNGPPVDRRAQRV